MPGGWHPGKPGGGIGKATATKPFRAAAVHRFSAPRLAIADHSDPLSRSMAPSRGCYPACQQTMVCAFLTIVIVRCTMVCAFCTIVSAFKTMV